MILIHCNHLKIGEKWLNILSEKYGNDQVVLSNAVTDKEKIDIALCWKAPEKMLHEFPNLKFIQSLGAGVDHIFDKNNDVPNAIISRIVDPQLSLDMYEFILSIVMNDLKCLTTYRDQQKESIWKEKKYRTIDDVTLGILGLGVIGSLVAKKMSGHGFKTMGWSRSQKSIEGVDCFSGPEALDVMLSQTDYLINILPLTDNTRGFINSDLLGNLKKGSFVINVGRGPHVVDEELLAAIDGDQLSGAALDVFHQEPLAPDHPFWKHPKILLTPHIASITNIETAMNQVFENINRFRNEGKVNNQVFAERQY